MQLRQVLRLVGREVRILRQSAQISGGRDALVARSRLLLGVSGLESRADASDDEAEADKAVVHDHLFHLQATADQLGQRVMHLERRLADWELARQVPDVTAWVGSALLESEPLVSVVIVTRDRCRQLAEAVESVRAQVYGNWELIIVDDGSRDATPELLDRLAAEDTRITVISQSDLGVGAARNAGVSAARGDFICYLDDDNYMQPLWLKAVAWASGRHPEIDVLYGARLCDIEESRADSDAGLPYMHIERFDRDRLERGNFIDLGVLAHRRNLAEAVFDESLESLGDWDLVLRLTARRTPLVLPVVAVHYRTSAPNRISQMGRTAVSEARIRERLLRDRSLRVLAYNSLFPLVPETYIADEMKALTDNGAALAWYTDRWSPSPVRLREPVYLDIDKALSEFRPDLLVVYWASFAHDSLDRLTRLGMPFAVRVHSFDFDPEIVARVRDHPLCVGVWAYPHLARQVDGLRSLVPLLTDLDSFPTEEADRSIVLSASAGLPKKDWPTLVGAFSRLAADGVDCRIVVGLTHNHEDEPQVIRQLIAGSGAPVMLSVDVPHDQVLALLARTAVVVYSKQFGGQIGMPRSIVEGLYAGTSVIMPDQPEVMLTGGPNCRTYRQAEDIVRHVREVLAGGPAILEERAANRLFAEQNFADPALASSFAAELRKAWAIWKAG
jgi:glycosyltransferase involved in cell wall biosynthesis